MSAPVNHSGHPVVQLSAVHVCRSCGAGTERSGVSLESMINGLVRCRACGHEGPLNIEILIQNGR
jgi:DNA-directed RNA polymerase subunit RPC12/RpoP